MLKQFILLSLLYLSISGSQEAQEAKKAQLEECPPSQKYDSNAEDMIHYLDAYNYTGLYILANKFNSRDVWQRYLKQKTLQCESLEPDEVITMPHLFINENGSFNLQALIYMAQYADKILKEPDIKPFDWLVKDWGCQIALSKLREVSAASLKSYDQYMDCLIGSWSSKLRNHRFFDKSLLFFTKEEENLEKFEK